MNILKSPEHRNRARAALHEAVRSKPWLLHDPDTLLDELRRCCPDHSLLVEWLVRALEEGLCRDLESLPDGQSIAPLVPLLLDRLRSRDSAASEEFLRWVVNTWAEVLGREPLPFQEAGLPVELISLRPRRTMQLVIDALLGALSGLMAYFYLEMILSEAVPGWKCAALATLIAGSIGLPAGLLGAAASTTGRGRQGAILGGGAVAILTAALAGAGSNFVVAMHLLLPTSLVWIPFIVLRFAGVACGSWLGARYGRSIAWVGLILFLPVPILNWVFAALFTLGEDHDPEAAWFARSMEVTLLMLFAVCLFAGFVGYQLARRLLEWRGQRTGHKTLRGHRGPMSAVALSPSGQNILCADLAPPVPGSIRQKLRRWFPPAHHDQEKHDHALHVWDLATRKQRLLCAGHFSSITTVAWFPDGQRVVSGGHDLTLRVWDVASGQQQLVLEGHREEISEVAVSADGRRVASASQDGTIRLWDTANGQLLRTVRHGSGSSNEAKRPVSVTSIAFSSDGQRIYSAGEDGVVREWTTNDFRAVRVFHVADARLASLAVSDDGRRLIAGGDGTVCIWDLDTGRELRQMQIADFDPKEPQRSGVRTVRFLPDSTMPVVAVRRRVLLWATDHDDKPTVAQSGMSDILSLDVVRHGSWLATGLADHTVRVRAVSLCFPTVRQVRGQQSTVQPAPSDTPPVRSRLRHGLGRSLRVALGLFFGAMCSLVAAACVLVMSIFVAELSFAWNASPTTVLRDFGLHPDLQRALSTLESPVLVTTFAVTLPIHCLIALTCVWSDWTLAVVRTRIWFGMIRALAFSANGRSWLWLIPIVSLCMIDVSMCFQPLFWMLFAFGPLLIEGYLGAVCGGLDGCVCVYRACRERRSEPAVFHSHCVKPPVDHFAGLRWPLAILYVVFLIVFHGFHVATDDRDGTLSGRGVDQALPVSEILAEYRRSPESARTEFQGGLLAARQFKISGVIQRIDSESLVLSEHGNTVALARCTWLRTPNLLIEAEANTWQYGDKRKRLRVGQVVELYGECLGLDAFGKLLFRRCQPDRRTITDLHTSLVRPIPFARLEQRGPIAPVGDEFLAPRETTMMMTPFLSCVAQRLTKGSAILRFVRIAEQFEVIVIRSRLKPQSFRLAQVDDISRLASDWNSFVAELSTAKLEDQQEAIAQHDHCVDLLVHLGRHLWPDRLDELLSDVRSVLMVPDEPLADVPFHALLHPRHGYLNDRFDGGIAYAPSLAVWEICRRRADVFRQAGILGDPRRGDCIERSQVLDPPASDNVLTFQGAGRFDSAHPEESWIDLPDGRLRATELTRGASDWRTVRAFVCLANGSASLVTNRQGTQGGFSWAALRRGAANFVGTLWPLPEDTRQFFTESLMRHWRTPASLVESVRAASLELAHAHEPSWPVPYCSPLIWAPFRLIGSDV